VSVSGWDVEWAATKASEAMRYLAAFYPECSGFPKLHLHQDAAHEAAVSGDREKCLEALRSYMRARRYEAMRIRKEAA
jgi:hypothetical protein